MWLQSVSSGRMQPQAAGGEGSLFPLGTGSAHASLAPQPTSQHTLGVGRCPALALGQEAELGQAAPGLSGSCCLAFLLDPPWS